MSFLDRQKDYGSLNKLSLQQWWAEKCLRKLNTSKPKADKLQQQKTIYAFTPDSHEKKSLLLKKKREN